MLRITTFATLSISLFASACADTDDYTEAQRRCAGTVTTVPEEPVTHFPVGTPIEWSTNPPVTGDHYEHWPKWDRHYTDLDRGFYVHGLEHGGIALLYNCPEGCPDIVESMIEIVAEAPTDELVANPPHPFVNCTAPVRNRLLVTSDPLLPPGVKVAAVAWNTSYTASCFNPHEIKAFIDEHYGQAPEDICFNGLLDEVGGTFIEPAPDQD